MLLTALGGFSYGDMIIQLIFFLILIVFVVGVIFLIVYFNKRTSRLNQIEEKLDELLSEKNEKNK